MVPKIAGQEHAFNYVAEGPEAGLICGVGDDTANFAQHIATGPEMTQGSLSERDLRLPVWRTSLP